MLSPISIGVVIVRSLVLVAVFLALSLALAGCPGPESGPASSDQVSSDTQDEESLAELYPFDRITTREMFKQRVGNAGKPIVVIFVSNTCSACKTVGEQVIELSQEFGDSVDFYAVVKQDALKVVMEMKVHGFPTVYLFFDGRKVSEWAGLDIGGLRAEINRLVENE